MIEPVGKLVFIVHIDGFSALKHRNECLYTVQNTGLTAENYFLKARTNSEL